MSFLGLSNDAPLAARLAALPRSRWIIAGLAVVVTAVVMTGFLLESRSGYSGRVVQVVFFKSWDAKRTVADIHADRAVAVGSMKAQTDASRAYIATLPKAKQEAAQAQYDNYVASLPTELRPAGWKPPEPKPAPAEPKL